MCQSDVCTNDRVSAFFDLYYHNESRTWKHTYWQGVACQKCPLDLWIYQEIIWETRPDIIIESGTAAGGSTLFLASMCDLANKGSVISIDIVSDPLRPSHPRISYLHGSSTAEETIETISSRVSENDSVLIILDSDHTKEHVARELEVYARFVRKGGYLIVEDTCVNGHSILPGFGPGPHEAVDDFLAKHPQFTSDRTREKFFLTFNPSGYLKRS